MQKMTITPTKAFIHRTNAVRNPVQITLATTGAILILLHEIADDISFLEQMVSCLFMGMEPVLLIPIGILLVGLSFVFIPDVIFDRETGMVKASYFGFKAYYICPIEDITAINFKTYAGVSWKRETGILLKNGKYVKIVEKLPMTEMDEITGAMKEFLGVDCYAAPDLG
ncbi:MAG: hypothetical protein LWY06_11720 [Firmicutes bacterium]|nr:hypothetical protein [Bacillota bacterium]